MWYETTPTVVKLTQAQYDALDTADKMNGTIYFITDGTPHSPTDGLVATNVGLNQSEYTASSL